VANKSYLDFENLINEFNLQTFVLPDLLFFMECGICNAIKKWLTKKDDKGDKDDMTDLTHY